MFDFVNTFNVFSPILANVEFFSILFLSEEFFFILISRVAVFPLYNPIKARQTPTSNHRKRGRNLCWRSGALTAKTLETINKFISGHMCAVRRDTTYHILMTVIMAVVGSGV